MAKYSNIFMVMFLYLLLHTNAFAMTEVHVNRTSEGYGPRIWVGNGYAHCFAPYNSPIEFNVQNSTRFSDTLSLHIYLSSGIQKLSGDLNWQGYVSKFKLYGETLSLQINSDGLHTVVTTIQFPLDTIVYPYIDTTYFYAKDGFVRYVRGSFQERDRAWIDSVVQIEKVRGNLSDMMKVNDINIIAYQTAALQCVIGGWISNYYGSGYPDSISKIICENQLLASPPRLELVDAYLNRDSEPYYSNSKHTELIALVKQQLSDLYALDQQIIGTTSDTVRRQLLLQRNGLQQIQLKARQNLLNETSDLIPRF